MSSIKVKVTRYLGWDSVVCHSALALRNLAIDDKNKELIGELYKGEGYQVSGSGQRSVSFRPGVTQSRYRR